MGNSSSSKSKYPGQRRPGGSSSASQSSSVPPSTAPRQASGQHNGQRRLGGQQRSQIPQQNNNTGPNVQTHAGPGAFSVDPSSGPVSVFRVTVPEGVRPGQEFQVYAGTRLVRVRCPPNIRQGQSLQITVPADPTVTRSMGPPPMLPPSGDGAPVETPIHLRPRGGAGGTSGDDDSNPSNSGAQPRASGDGAYMVTIPEGIVPGQQFPVNIHNQQLMVTCPPNARAGMVVRINPPPPPPGNSATNVDRPPERAPNFNNSSSNNTNGNGPPSKPTTQLFEVVVPRGVKPNQPFALLAGGQRVLVTCPPDAGPGQRIRFQLPINLLGGKAGAGGKDASGSTIDQVRLSYDKDGWTRTIRVSDMKFQWIRVDQKGDVDMRSRFDAAKSAYVRKLDFLPGLDPRMRGGNLSLVPATQAVVDSHVRGPDGRELVSYSHIASAQIETFDSKAKWFFDTCQMLRVEWDEGHMRVNVRRDYLLSDSMMAVMSLSRKDLRKIWKFEFIGEEGIDAGGLAREWFQLVTEEIFNPDNGLWQYSQVNQMCMDINPASELSHPEDHLVYFRFLGRILGKALFDRQLVSGHMVRHLYKHLLGWPITLEDLELVDTEIYSSLKQLMDLEDVSMLCLDFTSTENYLGQMKSIELVKNGADIEVTNDNLPEYMECCLKYRMLGRVKPQLTELLLGFFDVLPEPLLTVFDFQELELLMCGLPEIDIDDWRANTDYSGTFENTSGNSKMCRWFWQVVSEDFDQEHKARLLQFVTGTSGVPSRGFSVLQGHDGNIRKFTIHGMNATNMFPRAHTCFNRLDLPNYESKAQLHDKLKLALEMAATGFDIE
jgi:hypothetical protein